MDGRFSRMLSTWRQMALQMENGISYKDAMYNAFCSSYVDDDGDHWLGAAGLDAQEKVEIQEVIERYCQGLDDNTLREYEQKGKQL